MSKMRDDSWKRLQRWRRLLTQTDVPPWVRQRNFDQEIRLAFEAFNLNPSRSADYELLLGVFAASFFPIPGGLTGKGPRKKAWNGKRVDQLIFRARRIINSMERHNTKTTAPEIAGFMKEIWPADYSRESAATLAHRLNEVLPAEQKAKLRSFRDTRKSSHR
jgi:hypothetical protein